MSTQAVSTTLPAWLTEFQRKGVEASNAVQASEVRATNPLNNLQLWLLARAPQRGTHSLLVTIQHYQKIVVALKETIRLMAESDALIPGWPLP